jgi:hypothetical protein
MVSIISAMSMEHEFEIPRSMRDGKTFMFPLTPVKGVFLVSASFEGEAWSVWGGGTPLKKHNLKAQKFVVRENRSRALNGDVLINIYDPFVDGSPSTQVWVNDRWEVVVCPRVSLHRIAGKLRVLVEAKPAV